MALLELNVKNLAPAHVEIRNVARVKIEITHKLARISEGRNEYIN